MRRSLPMMKNFKEFEYGFKIRDKSRPNDWCCCRCRLLTHPCSPIRYLCGLVGHDLCYCLPCMLCLLVCATPNTKGLVSDRRCWSGPHAVCGG